MAERENLWAGVLRELLAGADTITIGGRASDGYQPVHVSEGERTIAAWSFHETDVTEKLALILLAAPEDMKIQVRKGGREKW